MMIWLLVLFFNVPSDPQASVFAEFKDREKCEQMVEQLNKDPRRAGRIAACVPWFPRNLEGKA